MTSIRLLSTICGASDASSSTTSLSENMEGLSAIQKALRHHAFVKKVGQR
eukprot:CAMPEP_0181378390 /NCGR_PEP_ID=MMETSP1106-20121128/18435_1 /TAXON_ID=81844 /ORGANISM="Mantoniella antarctica, Strain SL-175" /LENGTH=49 /DNA_ID= /DNA_START= /DNA_END= /DNA_ORIENTATION=